MVVSAMTALTTPAAASVAAAAMRRCGRKRVCLNQLVFFIDQVGVELKVEVEDWSGNARKIKNIRG
jgi:hypothetical protein